MHFVQRVGVDDRLPVFVFPTSLTFYSDDQSTHKQVLTLYNPYDFVLKFKVLSTAPKKFSVIESEGSIKPRCCVDIVVRHKDICINNEGIKDKFRVQLTEFGQKQVKGYKDVIAVLLPKQEKQLAEDTFESLNISGRDLPAQVIGRNFTPSPPHSTPATRGPSWVVILSAVLCIMALMLPTSGDLSSSLPPYLSLSFNQKLIAAYILGLVTMAVLKS